MTISREDRRTLVLSCACCLAPMLVGAALYGRLPDPMPVHYTFGDVADNWAPKPLALFGLPLFMAAIQAASLLATFHSLRGSDAPRAKMLQVLYWLVPVMGAVTYTIMVEVPLGSDVYVGKSICLVVGIAFIVMGNYVPKVPFAQAAAIHHPAPADEPSWRRQSRRDAAFLIGLGVAFLALVPFV